MAKQLSPQEKKEVKAKKDKDKQEKEKGFSPMEQARSYMEENEEDHYNFEPCQEYRFSTGSLKMDILTGGGITPGVVRLVGINSGGKTSEALELCRQFILARKNRRILYIKAEGKFSPELKARSGVKFVTNPDEWLDGTCLIYECNIFESVCNFMLTLIHNNPEHQQYMFVLDSLDGLILRDDLNRPLEEAFKVAGPQVLGKKLMQHMSLPLVKHGHVMIFTSQITAQPKIDPYASVPFRSFASSGGNWALHYPENIWEFGPRFKEHKILKSQTEKYSEAKNPIIGHLVPITVRKSNNEKNDVQVTYPIRYGRTGGTSIWIEREVGDVLLAFHALIKGSWIEFSPSMLEEVTKAGFVFPEKIQGVDNVYQFLEDNKPVTTYLFDKFRDALKQEAVIDSTDGDPLLEE